MRTGTRRLMQGEIFLTVESQKVLTRRHFAALYSPAKDGSLNAIPEQIEASPRIPGETALEIIELPRLDRRIEWPTLALAIVIYGLWLLTTFFWRDVPWPALILVGAWLIAWHLNLQHEIIHGHPTPNRVVNHAIGIWPLLAVAAVFDLSHHSPPSPSGRQPDRPVRGSGELLLDFRRLARSRPGQAQFCACPINSARPGRFRAGVDDRRNRRRGDSRCVERQARRARHSLLALPAMRAGAPLGHRRLRHAAPGLRRLLRLSRRESGDGALFRRASRRPRAREAHRRRERAHSRAAVPV